MWVGRIGNVAAIRARSELYLYPRLSPDDTRLAINIGRAEFGGGEIWILDFARDTLSRFERGIMPLWTPDGSAITYSNTLQGAVPNIVQQSLDGRDRPEPLTDNEHITVPLSWASDGNRLLIEELRPDTLRVLDLETREVNLMLSSPANERPGSLSPDGAWIVYASDETGEREIYVQAFPGPGRTQQVSTDGGTEPLWARNGREIFYRSGDKMMVVPVSTEPELNLT